MSGLFAFTIGAYAGDKDGHTVSSTEGSEDTVSNDGRKDAPTQIIHVGDRAGKTKSDKVTYPVVKLDEVLASTKGLLIVKLGTEWCGPCKTLARTMKSMASNPSSYNASSVGRVGFASLNADESEDSWRSLRQGGGIPQLVAFYNGKRIPLIENGNSKMNIIGGMSESEMAAVIRDTTASVQSTKASSSSTSVDAAAEAERKASRR